jgi:hypothetical protein
MDASVGFVWIGHWGSWYGWTKHIRPALFAGWPAARLFRPAQ